MFIDRSSLLLTSISQSHLNLWQSCQRRFQHYFLDCLTVPTHPNQLEKMLLGEQFHLLMQQRELGLEVEHLAESDRHLQDWLLAFETNPPQIILGDRHTEHRRTIELKVDGLPYTMMVVYDLLILGEQSAQIIDWKTYNRPRSPQELQTNWQTKLYLYVLAETSKYLPDQISMIYWFANTGTYIPISYTEQQHQQTASEIYNCLQEITIAQQTQTFSQLSLNSRDCDQCEFAYRCGRVETLDAERNLDVSAVSTYPEIPL